MKRLCGRDTKAELVNLCDASIADSEGRAGGILDYIGELEDLPPAQTELIAQDAYARGFEQGRTQGMIDAQGEPMSRLIDAEDSK